jgi:hypothetical protein
LPYPGVGGDPGALSGENIMSVGELIARLAPKLVEHFKGRALLDFRVANEQSRLCVLVNFSTEPGHWSDLKVLSAIAEAVGARVHHTGIDRHAAWIEISVSVPAIAAPIVKSGVVVPFRPRRMAMAAAGA